MRQPSILATASLLLFYGGSPAIAAEPPSSDALQKDEEIVLECSEIEKLEKDIEVEKSTTHYELCEDVLREQKECVTDSLDTDEENIENDMSSDTKVDLQQLDVHKNEEKEESEEVLEKSDDADAQNFACADLETNETHQDKSMKDSKEEHEDESINEGEENQQEIVEKNGESNEQQPVQDEIEEVTTEIPETAETAAEVKPSLIAGETLVEESQEESPLEDPVETAEWNELSFEDRPQPSREESVTTASVGNSPLIETDIEIETIAPTGIPTSNTTNTSTTNWTSGLNGTSNDTSTGTNSNTNTTTGTNTNTNNSNSQMPSYSNQVSNTGGPTDANLNRLPKTGGLMDQSRMVWMSLFLIVSGLMIRITARKKITN